MPAEGFIQVHVYTTSEAQIPVPGAAVAIVADDGTLLAARLTNESGQIQPVAVKVPDASESRDPNFRGKPFTQCPSGCSIRIMSRFRWTMPRCLPGSSPCSPWS